MVDKAYNSQNSKIKRTKMLVNDLEANISLKEIIKQTWIPISKERVTKALSNDLKQLLNIEDIHTMVKELLSIEHNLTLITYENHQDGSAELSGLSNLYSNLSPLLLRSLLENSLNQDHHSITKGWKEALRIAVEEEIYVLQERLFN